MAKPQNFPFNNTAALFLRANIITRQKHHPDSQTPAIITMAGTCNMLDKEIPRDRQMNASPVAGHAIGIHCTAMPDRLQGFNGGIHNRAARTAIDRGNKSHPAGIMFHLGAVDTSLYQPCFGFFTGFYIILCIEYLLAGHFY